MEDVIGILANFQGKTTVEAMDAAGMWRTTWPRSKGGGCVLRVVLGALCAQVAQELW